MGALPSGTVSLLFSDIEGSTAVLTRLGAGYVETLRQQRRMLRRAWSEHSGTELGTEGDSFFVAFATAGDAISAAAHAQRELNSYQWPLGETVRVRMGIHTGSPAVQDGGYVGIDVHRAARIAGAAHGGQVVVSSATAALVAGSLPEDVELLDLGNHQLKDLRAPEHLFQLTLHGLPSQFPPLKSLGAPSSLPAPASPLVGRLDELEALSQLLAPSEHRLVTLTGAGGSGKTRLAIAVANSQTAAFPDGVFFVSLASITRPDLVLPTIAATLNVKEVAAEGLGELLRRRLHDQRALILLDNFEQVRAGAWHIADLLTASTAVTFLVTSRAPLRITGEREYPLAPLPLPQLDPLPTLPALRKNDAVRLFTLRARAVTPEFEVSQEEAPTIAAICHRLDGLPLAIELAAARMRILSPKAVLARLDARLRLLTSGPGDVPTRQQTLRSTIAWSFELLAPAERAMFVRLGVLAGGGSLEAIEAICRSDGQDPDILDLVESLVSQNLLQATREDDGETRFLMLETMLEYSRELLAQSVDAAIVRRRHAEFYLALAEAARPRLTGSEQAQSMRRLNAERDNLRAALTWSASRDGDKALALRLGGALWHFWEMSGALSEGRRLLASVLSLPIDDDAVRLRSDVCSGSGTLAWAQGDYDQAWRLHEEALSLARRVGDLAAEAFSLNALGAQLADRRPSDKAEGLLEQARALAERIGQRRTAGMAQHNLAEVALTRGDYARARQLYEASLSVFRELGDQWATTASLHGIAITMLRQGNRQSAKNSLRESLMLATQVGENNWIAEGLEGLAAVAEHSDEPVRATRLLAAAHAIRRRIGAPIQDVQTSEHDQLLGALRDRLSDEEFERSWDEGSRLTVRDAVAEGTQA